MSDKKATYIELSAKEPLLDHKDNVEKCGQCLKGLIRYQVACEFLRQGKIGPENIAPMEEEVKKRWEDTFLFKEIARLRKTGLTLEEAIEEMQGRGYTP